MPGPRQPLAVLEANGRKHLTKKEKYEREQAELKVEVPEKVAPPVWLEKSLRKEFYEIAKQLIALEIFAELDKDVLGMYLTARSQWERAAEMTNEEQRKEEPDTKMLSALADVQAKFFRQARQCAGELGLSVSSRCKLVIPKKEEEETDPMEELLSWKKA